MILHYEAELLSGLGEKDHDEAEMCRVRMSSALNDVEEARFVSGERVNWTLRRVLTHHAARKKKRRALRPTPPPFTFIPTPSSFSTHPLSRRLKDADRTHRSTRSRKSFRGAVPR